MKVLLMPLQCSSMILDQVFIRHPDAIIVNPILTVIPSDFVRESVTPLYDLHMPHIEIPPWMLFVPAVIVELASVEMRLESATMIFVNKLLFVIVKFEIVFFVVESART